MTEYLQTLQQQMEQTPQDPIWHGEGNVWSHTEQVCRALQSLPAYRQADQNTQKLLYLAAAFHDVGKLPTTRREDGRWVAPGHGRVSAQMARKLLWLDQGLCGTRQGQQLREGVCGLIRHHGLPVHAIDEPDGKLRLLRLAANGSLAPGLTVKNLCILAQADILGRICPDQQELLEKVELCRELATETGCYEGPYAFPSEHTRFICLSGKDVPMDYPLYNDTWGEVLLLSGLPGTGKDTWIRKNVPELPMISLDDIRTEFSISPQGDQSPVAAIAKDRAKEFLRKKQPFVWNATNLSPQLRNKLIGLFTNYAASVRIVYLETTWDEQLRRNRNRSDSIPEAIIGRMLDTLIPPECQEAHRVQWHCI